MVGAMRRSWPIRAGPIRRSTTRPIVGQLLGHLLAITRRPYLETVKEAKQRTDTERRLPTARLALSFLFARLVFGNAAIKKVNNAFGNAPRRCERKPHAGLKWETDSRQHGNTKAK